MTVSITLNVKVEGLDEVWSVHIEDADEDQRRQAPELQLIERPLPLGSSVISPGLSIPLPA